MNTRTPCPRIPSAADDRQADRKRRAAPVIAITMGDPGGIGPEVALKAAAGPMVGRACRPLVVGDIKLLRGVARRLEIPAEVVPFAGGDYGSVGRIAVWDVTRYAGRVSVGRPSKAGGAAAAVSVECAVNMVGEGHAEGMVTAPVSKESFARAGYGMIGHTELLASLTGTRFCTMMLVRGRLRVVFATTHVPLCLAAKALTGRGLLERLRQAHRYLNLYLGVVGARLGVACLNPHCGEGGLLGSEEQAVIAPAIRKARAEGIRAEGPYPADSIYRPKVAGGFDAIVAMYHDQGMIPLKLRDHDRVVNITLGIPIVRTSPGHGTAFDIAGKGVASERSMANALLVCARIAKRLRNVD
jgi:4-hydroxythreonine-4-phosphate dehydrogenase